MHPPPVRWVKFFQNLGNRQRPATHCFILYIPFLSFIYTYTYCFLIASLFAASCVFLSFISLHLYVLIDFCFSIASCVLLFVCIYIYLFHSWAFLFICTAHAKLFLKQKCLCNLHLPYPGCANPDPVY